MHNKIIIRDGIAHLDKLTTANMITAIDYAGLSGRNTIVIRYTIELTKANKFAIKEFRYNIPHAPFLVSALNYGSFDVKSSAEEKVQQLCTVKEQNGFQFIDRRTWKIAKLFNTAFLKVRPEINYCNTFSETDWPSATIQRVPDGIRVFIKINEFGESIIHEANHINLGFDEHGITTPELSCFIDALKSHADFRGCLIEGFLSETKFYITDAAYLVNTNLMQSSWGERAKQIPSILAAFNLEKFNIEFLHPESLNSKSQLFTGLNIVKKPNAAFILYCKASEQLITTSHYSHVEPSSFSDGQLRCTGIMDFTEEITIKYPRESFNFSLEEYYVIKEGKNNVIIC